MPSYCPKGSVLRKRVMQKIYHRLWVMDETLILPSGQRARKGVMQITTFVVTCKGNVVTVIVRDASRHT